MNEVNIAMGIAGAVAALSLSAVGSALGTGFAASSAIGAWKKCYAQNRPVPFVLLSYVGAPLTQTLYGMILMFAMIARLTIENQSPLPGTGFAMLVLGIAAGIGIGTSALFQGRAAAAAADAQGETGQGLANNMAALGVIETVAIFVMVFAYIAVNAIPVEALPAVAQ